MNKYGVFALGIISGIVLSVLFANYMNYHPTSYQEVRHDLVCNMKGMDAIRLSQKYDPNKEWEFICVDIEEYGIYADDVFEKILEDIRNGE